MTRGHTNDLEVNLSLKTPARPIGVIGSKKDEQCITPHKPWFHRENGVTAPIGLNIGRKNTVEDRCQHYSPADTTSLC